MSRVEPFCMATNVAKFASLIAASAAFQAACNVTDAGAAAAHVREYRRAEFKQRPLIVVAEENFALNWSGFAMQCSVLVLLRLSVPDEYAKDDADPSRFFANIRDQVVFEILQGGVQDPYNFEWNADRAFETVSPPERSRKELGDDYIQQYFRFHHGFKS